MEEEAKKEGLVLAAVKVSVSEKCGYIDKAGKIVINPQFDDAGYFSDEVAMVCIGEDCFKGGGKRGYIDKAGKFVINPQFDDACGFERVE